LNLKNQGVYLHILAGISIQVISHIHQLFIQGIGPDNTFNMKITSISYLLALAASSVTAQDYNQTGPFALKLAYSANETLNGQYLYACHAGAAIEGLCLVSSLSSLNPASTTFYQNYTTYSPTGPLIWNLPIRINESVDHVSEPMSLSYNPGSNVAVPLFNPGYPSSGNEVGFTSNGSLYIATYYNDSTFQPGVYPNPTGSTALTNWFVCSTIVGGYFYQALAWVTAGTPHNPTCEAVQVIKVDLAT
jgi:hypothetical protein